MKGEGTATPVSPTSDVAEAIRRWRQRTGRSLVDLHDATGIGVGSLVLLASGERVAPAWVVKRVMRVVAE